VVTISQHIAEGTRQQSAAGNEIAAQIEGIVQGIDQTSATIADVTEKAQQMREASTACGTDCLFPLYPLIKAPRIFLQAFRKHEYRGDKSAMDR
jgi:hypothetical protein